jgi:hypothetical protein
MKRSRAPWVRLVLALLLVAAPARATTDRFSAHLELGLGSTTVRPLEREGAPGGSVSMGVSVPTRGALHLALEFEATAGGDPPGIGYIPEASRPGDRTLTTFLVGSEFKPAGHRGVPFAFVGAGLGHSTLTHAFGVFIPPYDRWFVPPRNLTALAIGAGAGYRVSSGPGPLGLSVALRTQLMPHSKQVVASTTTLTFGLAY